MYYYSTRNSSIRRSAAEAIVEGIAPDGGLYLPDSFPALSLQEMLSLDNDNLAASVIEAFFPDFQHDELLHAVKAAYASFENGDTAPLAEADSRFVLELWHGPTCAFKDVALTLLPRLLRMAADKCGIRDEICILTATSGDTGSAALSGFSDVPGTRIAVFYPAGGVSPMQELQMTGCPGLNTTVCAVHGNFDDTQTGVKNIFTGMTPPEGVRFSSANSINIGRLVPQVVYYYKAYRDLVRTGRIAVGDPVDFVVPTGNFGDILAGYFAKKTGLPVGRLVCASNSNNVLSDFFAEGIYDRRRDFHLTASPSMDILISSNLERLIAMKLGCDGNASCMKSLQEEGFYRLPEGMKEELQQEFAAGWASEEETAAAIGALYRKAGYLMDPHTAVAWAVCDKLPAKDGRPVVVLSTASPYKFPATVLKAIGETPAEDELASQDKLEKLSGKKLPAPLKAARARSIRHHNSCSVREMPAFIRDFLAR